MLEWAGKQAVKIAVSTDAHGTREFGTVRYGIDQARRAGLEPASRAYELLAMVLAA